MYSNISWFMCTSKMGHNDFSSTADNICSSSSSNESVMLVNCWSFELCYQFTEFSCFACSATVWIVIFINERIVFTRARLSSSIIWRKEQKNESAALPCVLMIAFVCVHVQRNRQLNNQSLSIISITVVYKQKNSIFSHVSAINTCTDNVIWVCACMCRYI